MEWNSFYINENKFLIEDGNIIIQVICNQSTYKVCMYVPLGKRTSYDYYFPLSQIKHNFLDLLKKALLYSLPRESSRYIKLNNLLRAGKQKEFEINKNGCLYGIHNSGICL